MRSGQTVTMSQPALDFGDEPFDDPGNPTYSVGELAVAINSQLRRGFDDGVWVRGEIDGLQMRGAHTYFALVEDGENGRAVLNVSLFAPMRRNLMPLLKRSRLELANGMKVRIFGQLDFYAPTGRLGLKMAGIDPRFTLGELSQARDQVVRRLVAAGLFDANRAKALSPIPLRVGVVASVGSAAWHDFRHELDGSGYGFQLSVCDARVQGEWAEPMVAAAIRTLGRRRDLDCVVVIRGGGARNELATFDAESIAMAIVTSPIPVLTGLGHEVDRSVADEVAHTTLKTPTACAGALVSRVAAHVAELEATYAAIVRSATTGLDVARGDLAATAHRIARRTHAAVERADERLAMRVTALQRAAPAPGRAALQRLDVAEARLSARARSILDRSSDRLDVLAARIAALDPAVQLARGWSITRAADGSVVRSVTDVTPGAALSTRVADGTIVSTVDRIIDTTVDRIIDTTADGSVDSTARPTSSPDER
jgi:exodeoxyribonuclease VII large subunit